MAYELRYKKAVPKKQDSFRPYNGFVVFKRGDSYVLDSKKPELNAIRQIIYAKPPYRATYRAEDKSVFAASRYRSSKGFKIEESFSCLGQKWKEHIIEGKRVYIDQYGFAIIKRSVSYYELYRNDQFLLSGYTKSAMQHISLILLNDKLKSPK